MTQHGFPAQLSEHLIYTLALCASQKKEIDMSHGHREPNKTERKINKNNSNDKQKI